MYVIADENKPWIVLFIAETLEQVAEALRAQPDPTSLQVSVNDSGFSRSLLTEDQRQLETLLAKQETGDQASLDQ